MGQREWQRHATKGWRPGVKPEVARATRTSGYTTSKSLVQDWFFNFMLVQCVHRLHMTLDGRSNSVSLIREDTGDGGN